MTPEEMRDVGRRLYREAFERPQVFDVLAGEAQTVRLTPYGAVGEMYRGHGVEVVWVSKLDEAVDPNWFSQETVDVIMMVQGRLRIQFADPELEARTLMPGDVFVLPPGVRCRAYRWPRNAQLATIFIAVYPRLTG
jgi:hypothetical protein